MIALYRADIRASIATLKEYTKMRAKLYEIAVPTRDNKGKSYEKSIALFEEQLLAYADGFTRMPNAEGYWRDPKSGKVYFDVMRGYRVATSGKIFARIVDRAFDLFHDQLAIFTADIGSARIVSRPRSF